MINYSGGSRVGRFGSGETTRRRSHKKGTGEKVKDVFRNARARGSSKRG